MASADISRNPKVNQVTPLANCGLGAWLGTNAGLTGGLGIVSAFLLLSVYGAPKLVPLSIGLAILHWIVACALWSRRDSVPLSWALQTVFAVGGVAAAILAFEFLQAGLDETLMVPVTVCAAGQLVVAGVAHFVSRHISCRVAT